MLVSFQVLMTNIVKCQAMAMSTLRKLRSADKKLVGGLRQSLTEGSDGVCFYTSHIHFKLFLFLHPMCIR